MEKNKNIEMKIYELLGIKIFKKLVLSLLYISLIPLNIKKSKEERKRSMYNTASNYNIGRVKNYDTINNFKEKLHMNAGIHAGIVVILLPNYVNLLSDFTSLSEVVVYTACIGINLYCVMLQRYNCIRINKVLNKMESKYEKQKEDIKNELKEEKTLVKEHTYTIIDKKGKETNISFDDFIENASVEQLKEYREYLSLFTNDSNSYDIDISLPMKKNKILKLSIKK